MTMFAIAHEMSEDRLHRGQAGGAAASHSTRQIPLLYEGCNVNQCKKFVILSTDVCLMACAGQHMLCACRTLLLTQRDLQRI